MHRALALLVLLFAPFGLRAEPVTVFAAASLKPVLDRVLAAEAVEARAVYAGSSALARQIEAGAPADIFVSANLDWMDHLETGGHIAADSEVIVARNRLVLIAADPSEAALASIDDLPDGRIATALTDAVPAGIYARAALTHLGAWERLRPRLVEAQDVRAALRLALSGAVPYAIVYASDAFSAGLEPLFVFPGDSHPPIIYPAALTATAQDGAAELLDTIAEAGEAFAAAGFLPAEAP